MSHSDTDALFGRCLCLAKYYLILQSGRAMPSCSRATVMPRTLLLWASILVLLARMAAGISPEDGELPTKAEK